MLFVLIVIEVPRFRIETDILLRPTPTVKLHASGNVSFYILTNVPT